MSVLRQRLARCQETPKLQKFDASRFGVPTKMLDRIFMYRKPGCQEIKLILMRKKSEAQDVVVTDEWVKQNAEEVENEFGTDYKLIACSPFRKDDAMYLPRALFLTQDI